MTEGAGANSSSARYRRSIRIGPRFRWTLRNGARVRRDVKEGSRNLRDREEYARYRRDVREATKYIETAIVIDKAMVSIENASILSHIRKKSRFLLGKLTELKKPGLATWHGSRRLG
jgi:hypothetical protein